MTQALITNLEKLLDGPRDGALLRYSLANELFKAARYIEAAARCREALAREHHHSASWKLLGKALVAADDRVGALTAYREGITVATERGDVQAAKEMGVFLKRLERETAA